MPIENEVLIDCSQAERHLQLLDPTATSFTFQTFDDNKSRKNGSLAKILNGTLDKHWEELCRLSKLGAGVFVTVNETDGKGRSLEHMVRVRAVFQEADGPNAVALPLTPQIVNESSPGKYHRYLLVDGGQDFDKLRAIMETMIEDYGSDPNAKDVSRVLRLAGFPHQKDPANPWMVRIIEVNEIKPYSWDEITAVIPAKVRPPRLQTVSPALPVNDKQIEKMCDALKHISADIYRDDWMKVGMALKIDGYPFELWDRWSATATGETSDGKRPMYPGTEACRATWDSFKREEGNVVRSDCVFRLAESNGWDESRYILDQFKAMAEASKKVAEKIKVEEVDDPKQRARNMLRDSAADFYRIKKKDPQSYIDALEILVKETGYSKGELNQIVDHAGKKQRAGGTRQSGDWRNGLKMVKDYNGHAIVEGSLNNYVHILTNHPTWIETFAFNTLSDEVVKIRSPISGVEIGKITDVDLIEIKFWMHAEFPEIDPRTDIIYDAVRKIANHNKFNPIQDYLDGLPTWDGVVRLEALFIDEGGAEDTEYVRLVTKKWFVGAIARAKDPGCKMDYTLHLGGDQGLGKTKFLRAMMADPEWYLDECRPIGHPDMNFATCGKWIVEFGEMTSFKKADIEMSKQYRTRTHDEWRRPYDKFPIRKARTCVFASTQNPHGEFLNDSTGARRDWIINVTKKFDVERIENLRDLYWAEALHYYNAGVKWWPENDYEEALCQQVQEEYYLADPEEERLHNILKAHGLNTILTSEIRERLGISDARINRLMINRFKCKQDKNLNEMGGRGTKRGFYINRKVVDRGPGVIKVSQDGLRVERREDDNVIPFPEGGS